MSSSRRVAMTSAMAGCRVRRLDVALLSDFRGTLAECANGLCRSFFLAAMATLAIRWHSENQAFDV
jgi:hypothetical protein